MGRTAHGAHDAHLFERVSKMSKTYPFIFIHAHSRYSRFEIVNGVNIVNVFGSVRGVRGCKQNEQCEQRKHESLRGTKQSHEMSRYYIILQNMQYDLNKQLLEMNKMGNTIQSMIEPFLNNTNDDKKRIELWHLGKFIYNFDTSIEIQSVGEEPDFIIKKGEILIGVEVTRYFKEEIKNINSIEQLIKKSEKIFNRKYPDKKYYVCFNLKEQIIYNKHESDIIAETIADYINDYISGIALDKIDFIEHIQVIPYNHESFFQILSAYAVPPLTKENVEPYIIKKEKNIKKYIANTNSNLQWLLIVVSGANEASDYFYISDDVYSIKSSFNNIFILNDFKAEITQIL